jgi:hypothetical protein
MKRKILNSFHFTLTAKAIKKKTRVIASTSVSSASITGLRMRLFLAATALTFVYYKRGRIFMTPCINTIIVNCLSSSGQVAKY